VITDQDVAELYRCLLGRAPETPDTVAAFRGYYPDFAEGRLAVLGSEEFGRVLRQDTGCVTDALTRAFLRRAGGTGQPDEASRPDLAGAMRLMVRAHGAVRLAVVIGEDGPALSDLLPLGNAQAAALHILPHFPGFLPQTAMLPGGGTVFRVAFDPPALAAFLQAVGLRIDLLALHGVAAAWWDALRPSLADRAILAASGTPCPDWPGLEAPIALPGLTLRHQGGWFLPVTYDGGTPAAADETSIAGLTIAAIVRNEEAAVVNMLRSAAPIAGGFVVLDTGSTDATAARAESFLAGTGKPFIVAHGEPGRFDAMRNAALDLVPQSAAWVLMLDADEELCAEDRDALRALLPAAGADAYALPRYNYQGLDKSGPVTPYPDRQVRLLRRRDGALPRYGGAVHETVRGVAPVLLPLDAGALGQGRGGPHIHHLVRRFRSPAAEARKQDYYRRLAEVAGV
jgi:hypothetical protein